jgi:hypothetical protein
MRVMPLSHIIVSSVRCTFTQVSAILLNIVQQCVCFTQPLQHTYALTSEPSPLSSHITARCSHVRSHSCDRAFRRRWCRRRANACGNHAHDGVLTRDCPPVNRLVESGAVPPPLLSVLVAPLLFFFMSVHPANDARLSTNAFASSTSTRRLHFSCPRFFFSVRICSPQLNHRQARPFACTMSPALVQRTLDHMG